MSVLRFFATVAIVALTTLPESAAFAGEPSAQALTFALIVGTNKSVDADLAPLKYADDDAARYFDFFRLLDARTYLLSRFDDNTRRLHAEATAEAQEPMRAPFDRAVRRLSDDVARASAGGAETVVYVVYAGHGNVKNGEGYVALEDARITGGELAQIVKNIPATRVHVIVDACASYYLAYSRGPGGERRTLPGFHVSSLSEDPRVGVLLSTSSARESHEWDGFQAGVFSHEVLSGLYGAADADGDGKVSYREIAAFVSWANAAIPNERYRPDMSAQPPRDGDSLIDIRSGLRRRLVIDGHEAAHYFLEDGRGVRIADAHNAAGQTLSLVRPAATVPLYLRRADDDTEYLVTAEPPVIALTDLSAATSRVRSRGAAHEAFSLVFSLPYGREVVADYRAPSPPVDVSAAPAPNRRLRKTVGLAAMGIGVLGVGAGAALSIASAVTAHGAAAGESEASAASRNSQIGGLNTASAASFAAGGAIAVTGLVLFLWPSSPPGLQASIAPGGGAVGYARSF